MVGEYHPLCSCSSCAMLGDRPSTLDRTRITRAKVKARFIGQDRRGLRLPTCPVRCSSSHACMRKRPRYSTLSWSTSRRPAESTGIVPKSGAELRRTHVCTTRLMHIIHSAECVGVGRLHDGAGRDVYRDRAKDRHDPVRLAEALLSPQRHHT